MVYGIGNKGAKLLNGVSEQRPRFDWTDRNQSIKQLHLQHTLLISDVMVALEKACAQNRTVRLVREDELVARIKFRDPFRWTVNVRSDRLGLRPDKVFGLENTKTGEEAFYFLEADRATMPVVRQNLDQSSFHRKLLAYEATWTQNIHRTRLGLHRFRVLTVKAFAVQQPTGVVHKRVSEVVDELLAAKKAKGRSTLYITDLRLRLTRFADAFACPILGIGSQTTPRLMALNSLMANPPSPISPLVTYREDWRGRYKITAWPKTPRLSAFSRW
jgi:hypothetical protein